jgi:hypothetical protein
MRVFAWLALAVLIGAYICTPLADPDLWWHVAVGRWILSHGTVPTEDLWSIAHGTPWRAYSWSNEVVYALVERWRGEWGLAVAQLVLGVVLVASLQLVCGILSRSYFLGALLGAYTAVACYAHFSLRPQTVTWILFAWLLVVADRCTTHRVSTGLLAGAVALGTAWANSHLSAVLGLVALVGWALQGGRRSEVLRLSAVLAGCFLAGTLISPYVGAEWLTMFQKAHHVVDFQSIDEFKPASVLQFSSGFLILQIVLLVMLCWSRCALPAYSLLAVAALFVLCGVAVVKFLPYAVIILSATTAVWWRDHGARQTQDNGELQLALAIQTLRERFERLSPQTVGALGFFLSCLATMYIARVVRTPVNYVLTPKSSVDFIETERLESPVLNTLGVGGYLIYRFSSLAGEPRERVTLDGRTNLITPERWGAYQRAISGREGWAEYLSLLKPQTILWRNDSALVALLLESPDWCRVFKSGGSSVDYSVFISADEWRSRGRTLPSTDCSGGKI